MFPDDYVHLGGDEVDFDCWLSNPAIREWLKNRGDGQGTLFYKNRGDGQGNTPCFYKHEDLASGA